MLAISISANHRYVQRGISRSHDTLVSHLPHQEVEEVVVALLQAEQLTTVQVTLLDICNETCRHISYISREVGNYSVGLIDYQISRLLN